MKNARFLQHTEAAKQYGSGVTGDALKDFHTDFGHFALRRIETVGADQYETEAGQKFETMSIGRLATELSEELADVINYASFMAVAVNGMAAKFNATSVDNDMVAEIDDLVDRLSTAEDSAEYWRLSSMRLVRELAQVRASLVTTDTTLVDLQESYDELIEHAASLEDAAEFAAGRVELVDEDRTVVVEDSDGDIWVWKPAAKSWVCNAGGYKGSWDEVAANYAPLYVMEAGV